MMGAGIREVNVIIKNIQRSKRLESNIVDNEEGKSSVIKESMMRAGIREANAAIRDFQESRY